MTTDSAMRSPLLAATSRSVSSSLDRGCSVRVADGSDVRACRGNHRTTSDDHTGGLAAPRSRDTGATMEHSCDAVGTSLSAHTDGEAGPLTIQQVDDHVHACDGCTAFAAELSLLDERVAAFLRVPVED